MKRNAVKVIGYVGGCAASFASTVGIQIGVLALTATMKSVPSQIATFTIGSIGSILTGMTIQKATDNFIQDSLEWTIKDEKKA